ncbi:T9SS type A sorting domain-containing protein [Taibaiella soli]|uniref:Secretion system C-terminal sorting domain-containing protein n=1 Tax=Taibaiella soli TaxID=1649169 RepID=A0A2W2AFA8_9BACT|nr:T9SS type A sorting domain-containing protein [Taibaiella soli]PZF74165.1 hypothetical protein DN068_03885 [Taibaiella soli]
MIKAKTLLTIASCFAAFAATAQYNLPQSRIWAMGNKVGLDFTNPANPVPITTALNNGNEAAASICDTNGALLFYTNGSLVWDKNGAAMPNGSNLTGTGTTVTWSTTQGAVIVPDPGNSAKYYLFSLTSQLYVNRIDMTLNNGLGDVDLTFPLRGQGLSDTLLTEKMTVVAGCNNSVWLMVHHQNSRVFRAYQITASGINTTPVLSNVGLYGGANYLQGVIKFSPDRTKLLSCNFRATALANAGVEVFDFNYLTGMLSNPVSISDSSFYGGSFSPNSTKIYAGSNAKSSIYQWDLSAANPAASKTILGPSGQYTDLKIGPDGKIYFGAGAGSPGYNSYRFMGRINFPDSAGVACGFKDSVTSLIFPAASGNYGALAQGMPNDIAVPFSGNQHIVRLDTTVCSFFQSYTFTAPAGYSSMTWDNGDTTLSRTVTARGTYWVISTSSCDTRVDTFFIRGSNMPALSITALGASLSATTGFSSYQWYLNGTAINGATSANYTATVAGLYKVFADYGGGCSDTANFNIPVSTAVGGLNNNQALVVYPNPATNVVNVDYVEPVNISLHSLDGKEVLQASNRHQFNVSNLAAGMYLLQITNGKQQVISRQMFAVGHK